ncbi:MAG: hypothetical protein R3A13_00095 [Bdellovibrionota bacterium]
MFETLARSMGIKVPGRINPRSVQFEVMGLKGKQVARDEIKIMASGAAKLMYGEALKSIGFTDLDNLENYQDVVDAILVGHLALTKIEASELAGISLEEYMEPERRTNTGNKLRAL